MRALAWEFNEPSLAAVDNQFLLGPSLLITPVLGQGMTNVSGVFPGAPSQIWYDWYSQEAVVSEAGENVTIQAPLGHIPIFVRGGAILPQQEALYTTAESRNSSWSLIAALNAEGAATGQIYLDDGESIKPNATLLVDLTANNGSLYASARGLYEDTNGLANITILGVQTEPSTVTLNGEVVSSAYNSSSQVLSLKGLEGCVATAWAQDWTLTWA